MAYGTIDIGAGASDYNTRTTFDSNTNICLENPANAAGVINVLEILLNDSDAKNCKFGTFSGSGTSYTNRDYESLGTVPAGSKQTYTGKNCEVASGDYLGAYSTAGHVERQNNSGTAIYYKSGDQFGAGTQTFTQYATGQKLAYYGTGITVPDAPTSVSASDNLPLKITITWTAGTGETGGHRVYRDGVDISGVVAHGTSSFDDTTGVIGTVYAYTVKAINDAGLSAASSADNGVRVACLSAIMKHNFIPSIGGY